MRPARILFLCALLLSPSLAFAAPQTFSDLAQLVVGLLNNATALLVTLGIVIYFWGIVSNTIKTGESDREKLRAYLAWGVVVLFVMVSIWGILNLLRDTLFGNSPLAPTVTPTATQPQFQTQSQLE